MAWGMAGACMAGMCVGGGMCSRGACMAGACVVGGGRAWQERRPLQRTVRILLECIVVVEISVHLSSEQLVEV